MRVEYDISVSRVSDFRIGDYTFEVGGKNKGQRQIESIQNAFVIKDNIEFGNANIIPLWHFGLTY
ncbi:MAG: ATP-binding protein, partial [Muribaculaceae bacterium]|nr:ATP-binding protein [Muribaculaceae bacterium]